MESLPQGRYHKEFRKNADKLVTEGGLSLTGQIGRDTDEEVAVTLPVQLMKRHKP
jgi:hypothetical protein